MGSLKKVLRKQLKSRASKLRQNRTPLVPPVKPASTTAPRGRLEASIPYSFEDEILLVGEGNFSFSASLITILQGSRRLVATSLDSESVVLQKYGETAQESVRTIEDCGGDIFYEVDATQVHRIKRLRKSAFTKVVFNFPHVGSGVKDQDRNIRTNQELLLGFFEAARQVIKLPCGEIHVTLKVGAPYDLWDVKTLAKARGLFCLRTLSFNPFVYPGYQHCRTLGFQEGSTPDGNEDIKKGLCKTFVFGMPGNPTQGRILS